VARSRGGAGFGRLNGVRIGGNALQPSIINQSDKPIIGYAVQRIADSAYNPVVSFVDFYGLAVGKGIQPGEEHPLGRFNVIRIASRGQAEGTLLGYDLKAVLFADGRFYGPDPIFLDFSERISAFIEGKPMSLYIIVPPLRLTAYAPLLRMWLSGLILATTQRKNPPKERTLMLVDEAGNVGKIDALLTAATLLRSFGLTLWTFWRTPRSLVFMARRRTRWLTMPEWCRSLAHGIIAWRRASHPIYCFTL
jgi:hypothetical protein